MKLSLMNDCFEDFGIFTSIFSYLFLAMQSNDIDLDGVAVTEVIPVAKFESVIKIEVEPPSAAQVILKDLRPWS